MGKGNWPQESITDPDPRNEELHFAKSLGWIIEAKLSARTKKQRVKEAWMAVGHMGESGTIL